MQAEQNDSDNAARLEQLIAVAKVIAITKEHASDKVAKVLQILGLTEADLPAIRLLNHEAAEKLSEFAGQAKAMAPMHNAAAPAGTKNVLGTLMMRGTDDGAKKGSLRSRRRPR